MSQEAMMTNGRILLAMVVAVLAAGCDEAESDDAATDMAMAADQLCDSAFAVRDYQLVEWNDGYTGRWRVSCGTSASIEPDVQFVKDLDDPTHSQLRTQLVAKMNFDSNDMACATHEVGTKQVLHTTCVYRCGERVEYYTGPNGGSVTMHGFDCSM